MKHPAWAFVALLTTTAGSICLARGQSAPVDPAATRALTLDQLLAHADAHAPSIATAQARVGLAEAAQITANVALPENPTLSFTGGPRQFSGETGFDYEIGLQQRLEIAGEPGLRAAAAAEAREVARAVVDEARWRVHVETHRLFVDLLLVRERQAQADRFVAFSQSLREIAARQVEAGETSPLTLLVADAELARSREAVIEARQLEASLRTQLAAFIGWPEPEVPPVEGTLPPIRKAPALDSLRTAAQHPALRTGALAVRASAHQAALADREAWPEPTLGVAYGREAAIGPEPATTRWLFSVALPLPVWQTNAGGRAEAEARVRLAERQRSARAVELESALRQTAGALDAAAERVALHDADVVPQLEKNLALLQRAFELGEVDAHQVSLTRERLLTATGRALDARVAWYETAAALEGLVGAELWAEEAP